MNNAVYVLSRIETSPSRPSETNAQPTGLLGSAIVVEGTARDHNSTSSESLGRLSHLGPSWKVSILYLETRPA